MRKSFLVSLIMVAIHWNMNTAQDFSGKYSLQTLDGELLLTFENKGNEKYKGILEGNGNTFILQGNVEKGLLCGIVGNEQDKIIFEAELNYSGLIMITA